MKKVWQLQIDEVNYHQSQPQPITGLMMLLLFLLPHPNPTGRRNGGMGCLLRMGEFNVFLTALTLFLSLLQLAEHSIILGCFCLCNWSGEGRSCGMVRTYMLRTNAVELATGSRGNIMNRRVSTQQLPTTRLAFLYGLVKRFGDVLAMICLLTFRRFEVRWFKGQSSSSSSS